MLLKKQKILIRTNEKGYYITMYVLNEKEMKTFERDFENIRNPTDANKFLDKWGVSPANIMIYGKTDFGKLTPDDQLDAEELLITVLGKPIRIQHPIDNAVRDSYPCYCCKEFNIPQFTDHRTAFSSWNCLLAKYKNPQFAVIIKTKSDGTKTD